MIICMYPEILKLPHYGLTLKGQFRHTEYGGMMIPELKLLLNAQSKPDFLAEFILITHTHIDQCISLPAKLSNRIKPSVIVPAENAQSLSNYVAIPSKFIPVTHGQSVSLNDKMYLKVYQLDHVIPACGYGLHVIRTVIKKEYIGITRKDIIKLRTDGVLLTEVIDQSILVYLSETSIQTFEQQPELFTYPYIIIECTYLPINSEQDLLQAINRRQIHWLQLYPIIQTHPQNVFIIYNFDHKYSDDQINNFKQTVTDRNIIFVD